MTRSSLGNKKTHASGKLHDLLTLIKAKPRLELLTLLSPSSQPPEVLARHLGISCESVKRHLNGMRAEGLVEMTSSGHQQLVIIGPRMTILTGNNGDQVMLLSSRGHWLMLQTDTNDGCVNRTCRKKPDIELITEANTRMPASQR